MLLGAGLQFLDSKPYDSRVEWLQGDNTKWIDTKFTALGDSEIDCTFIAPYNTQGDKNCVAWGARNGYGIKEASMMKSDINGNFYAKRNVDAPTAEWAATSAISNDAVIRGISTANNCVLYVNGQIAGSYNSSGVWSPPKTIFDLDYSITIFKVNNTSWTTYPTKVLNFKITKNGQELMNLYPVRKGNVGYMYDEVSGQLFGNSGDGEFAYGQDV